MRKMNLWGHGGGHYCLVLVRGDETCPGDSGFQRRICLSSGVSFQGLSF